MEVITADIEIRESTEGPRLYGVIVQEGRAATGGRSELFAPASIQWPSDGIGILLKHEAQPELRAIPERDAVGRISVTAGANPAIVEAITAGRKFMSVEFTALEERRTKAGVREIQRAMVWHAALVPDPEYDTAKVEIRTARRRVWL